MGWAKSPDICEPVQRWLHWLMLLWLVPPACALAGVNGFRGGTDFAKSAYLGGLCFITGTSSPERCSFSIIMASADGHSSGSRWPPSLCDGHSSGSGASKPLARRSSNIVALTYSRVYSHLRSSTSAVALRNGFAIADAAASCSTLSDASPSAPMHCHCVGCCVGCCDGGGACSDVTSGPPS